MGILLAHSGGMRWRTWTTGLVAVAWVALVAPSAARAAISIDPAADKVTTSRLELDFGDAAGNVEQLDSVRWRDSGGTQTGNLAANSAATGCGVPAQPQFAWGRSGSVAGAPQPVGDGSAGTWTPRGRRTVEISSSRPDACGGDSPPTPVRTRYTFFDTGGAANKVRVERTIAFSAGSVAPNASMRAYVPELPAAYPQVVHPDAAGTGLVTDTSQNPAAFQTDWNGTWMALNDPVTNAGVVILRETTSSPARLTLENDGSSNSSAVDLLKPVAGWKAPVTETEWLCFYDATSWPPNQRSATFLPSLCNVVPVPISTAPPAISGDPTVTGTLTTTSGAWDSAASLAIQWLRCTGASCTAIPGATGSSYMLTDADLGKQMRVDVTAAASGGETDVASSALTAGVKPGPPLSTGAPTVSGEAREDELLTGATGNWSGGPTSFKFQWERCATAAGGNCADVPGATNATYKLVRADVGSTMRLRVLGVNGQGTSPPAESAATAVVLPMVLRAAFTVTPQPTCTGIATRLDASASKTPNGPIVRYRFTYKVLPIPALIAYAFLGNSEGLGKYIDALPTQVAADGSDPQPVMYFNWNRVVDGTYPSELKSPAHPLYTGVRDPIVSLVLTVTDKAGRTDSVSSQKFAAGLDFAQFYADDSRKGCPKVRIRRRFGFAAPKAVATGTKALRAKVPCKTIVDCVGSMTVVKPATRVGNRRLPAVVLATKPIFTVRAHRSASITAKLTGAGRALLRSRRPIAAVVRLTSIDPLGRRTTRSSNVTLRPT